LKKTTNEIVQDGSASETRKENCHANERKADVRSVESALTKNALEDTANVRDSLFVGIDDDEDLFAQEKLTGPKRSVAVVPNVDVVTKEISKIETVGGSNVRNDRVEVNEKATESNRDVNAGTKLLEPDLSKDSFSSSSKRDPTKNIERSLVNR
jgi:hypothetical protein